MSGGGKGEMAPTTSNAIQPTQPAYLNGTKPMTMPAFMPGQQQALASQLTGGFGGTPKAFMDMLAKIHQPSQTLDFTKAGTKAPAPKAAPRSPLNAGGGGQVFVNGQWQPVLNTAKGGVVMVNGQWTPVMGGK